MTWTKSAVAQSQGGFGGVYGFGGDFFLETACFKGLRFDTRSLNVLKVSRGPKASILVSCQIYQTRVKECALVPFAQLLGLHKDDLAGFFEDNQVEDEAFGRRLREMALVSRLLMGDFVYF